MDSHYLDNLERSLAAYLSAALGATDGANVKPGRRAGLTESRPAIGITWISWTPRRVEWGGTHIDVTVRLYCYSVKQADEQADHREEGRLHLAALLALMDQGTVPFYDYQQATPVLRGQWRVDWIGGENPLDPQARSRSETHFDVIVRQEE